MPHHGHGPHGYSESVGGLCQHWHPQLQMQRKPIASQRAQGSKQGRLGDQDPGGEGEALVEEKLGNKGWSWGTWTPSDAFKPMVASGVQVPG